MRGKSGFPTLKWCHATALILMLAPTAGHSDFTDYELTPPPTPVAPTPTPTATPADDSEPGNGMMATPVPTPTPLPDQVPGSKPSRPTQRSTGQGGTKAQGGGDFLSGRFFGDVQHDTTAPVGLKADRVSGHRAQGLVELLGNAEVTQGSLKMEAAKFLVYGDPVSNAFERAVATGKVRVQKGDPAIPNELIRATAKEIEYLYAKGKMILRGGARLSRGSNCEITGDVLEFELVGGAISALGGESIRGVCAPPPATPKATPGAQK